MTEVTEAMRIAGEQAFPNEVGRDDAERIYLAMEAARIPAAPDEVTKRLKWHVGDNLRWLADQSDRPDYMPCGMLTGAFLFEVADRLSAIPAPAAPDDVVERVARALRKVHNQMTVEQLQGGMDMDLIRAQAAIAALSAIPIPAPMGEVERLRAALSIAETEARRFAGFYPEASDGRNTFVIFADKIAALTDHTTKDDHIRAKLAEIESYRASLPPADRAELERLEFNAQCESWIRAMAPCEHGVADFEQCDQCRNPQGEK